MRAAFWIALLGLALPLYSYLIYPVLMFVLASFVQTGRDAYYLLSRRERRTRSNRLPKVSILIAAHNEAEFIERTLTCATGTDYPAELREIIVGSDGSDDDTAALAKRFEDTGVQVLDFRERRGKTSVIRDCVEQATGEILVFTDANTMLQKDSVRNLVRHFENPRMGAVCGELSLVGPDGRPADEGLYWRYEVILKMLESRLGAVLGANGAIYAVRKDCFPRVREDAITDDFVIPMKVREKGKRVVYDPEANALEEVPGEVADEFRRRVRIGAGNWQALWELTGLLMPTKGFLSLSFWSHKVLRWFTPFLLAAAFVANIVLLAEPFWQVVFALQVLFYAAAGVGYLLRRMGLSAGPARLLYYFVALNAALAIGLVKGALGIQRAAWQRTARPTAPPVRN